MRPLVIQTGRANVLLREYTRDDAQSIFAVIDKSRAHLSKWGDQTSKKYPTLESVVKSIENPVSHGRLRMGIWFRGEFTGGINLQPLPEQYYAEIGYWLGADFVGKKLMTTAVRAMVSYAFSDAGYYFLTANTHQDNIASQRVLGRVGFRKVSEANVYINYRLSAHERST